MDGQSENKIKTYLPVYDTPVFHVYDMHEVTSADQE